MKHHHDHPSLPPRLRRFLSWLHSAAVVLTSALSLVLLSACGPSDARAADDGAPADQSGQEVLPELPAIGGVQDVWALEFGMNADRSTVRESLGDPIRTERPTVEGEEDDEHGLQVERWFYDGLTLTFLIDAILEREYLLSLRIDDRSVPMRGGLEIGMPLDEALELLGEPRVVNGASHVYFYRATTIEIIAREAVVEAVQLARALP